MAKVGGKNPVAGMTPGAINTGVSPANTEASKELTAKADDKKVLETKPEEKKSEEVKTGDAKTGDVAGDQKAPEAPKKEVKVLEPKAWQRIDASDPAKPKLVDQLTFLGEKMDYEPGFRAEYDWNNLDNSDGLKRVVTAKFPKSAKPDESDTVEFMGYHITIEKYGNSAVCKLEGPWADAEGNPIPVAVILEYVSLATVLDVLQDLLNPKGEDNKGTNSIPWGTIDQVIKKKRNLKSRIKTLGENDLPARTQKKKETPVIEAAKPEENAEKKEEVKA